MRFFCWCSFTFPENILQNKKRCETWKNIYWPYLGHKNTSGWATETVFTGKVLSFFGLFDPPQRNLFRMLFVLPVLSISGEHTMHSFQRKKRRKFVLRFKTAMQRWNSFCGGIFACLNCIAEWQKNGCDYLLLARNKPDSKLTFDIFAFLHLFGYRSVSKQILKKLSHLMIIIKILFTQDDFNDNFSVCWCYSEAEPRARFHLQNVLFCIILVRSKIQKHLSLVTFLYS